MISDSPDRNLALQLGDFGPLVIQPEEISEEEIARARYIVFPDQIPVEKFAAALEWAAVSESPVFCTASDLKRFEKEGFGAYRFNVLGGFREIGFETGSLRFVPARLKPSRGWRGMIENFAGTFGWSKREAFHVIAKSPNKGATLYLATPFIEKNEWAQLSRESFSQVFGSAHFGRVYWTALAERLGVSIDIVHSGDEARRSATTKIFGTRYFPSSEAATVSQSVLQGELAWKNVERGSGS